MKRVMITIIIFSLFLCGCGNSSKSKEIGNADKSRFGVWITYSEINEMLNSESGFEEELKKAAESCVSLGVDDVYIHIRSHSDSLYESKYFPKSEAAKRYDFDILKLMIESFHSMGLRVHAWINPYRVATATEDINSLDEKSPAYIWRNDDNPDNDVNVCIYNGIYLNPGGDEVRRLVLDGVREVLENYDVDGIHFDDYFYPTTDESFDKSSFEAYQKSAENPLSLEDWRRANVNTLISSCYSAIKYINNDIEFSVSPAADIQNNYNELYADVKEWCDKGYIDTVIPQIYFGFEYPVEKYSFNNLLKEWKKLLRNTKVNLIIGLASYKADTDSEADKEEWQSNYDIISRQAQICHRDDTVSGFCCFSYSHLFSEASPFLEQRENLKTFLKERNRT